MNYEVEQNDRPQIKQADTKFFLRFKPKDGIFSVYNRETKENKDLKSVDIIKISDSRFTVKAAQNEVGAFVFSGLYRDARSTITVLEKRDGKTGVIAEGPWKTIKTNPNLKYVRVLFCLYKDAKRWEKAQFDFMGIAAIQWQKVSGDGALTLAVSEKKDFETPRGNFYSIVKTKSEDVDDATNETAVAFAGEVKEVYESYDASYAYYANEKKEHDAMNGSMQKGTQIMRDIIPNEDIFKNAKEVGLVAPDEQYILEDEAHPELVPFD